MEIVTIVIIETMAGYQGHANYGKYKIVTAPHPTATEAFLMAEGHIKDLEADMHLHMVRK